MTVEVVRIRVCRAGEGEDERAVGAELLNPVVVLVGDVHVAGRVDHNPLGTLNWPLAVPDEPHCATSRKSADTARAPPAATARTAPSTGPTSPHGRAYGGSHQRLFRKYSFVRMIRSNLWNNLDLSARLATNYAGRDRAGNADRCLSATLGATWPRGRRVLHGGFRRGRDLSGRRNRGARGRRLPALRWQLILLGLRRVTAEQELQPRVVGRKHGAAVAGRRRSSRRGRAGRRPGRHEGRSCGRGTRVASGTDRRPLRTSLGDREAARRVAALTPAPPARAASGTRARPHGRGRGRSGRG